MLSAMRPFTPRLRLHRDRQRPDRLVLSSDVPLRAHALTLSVGAAAVVMAHGIGQLLAPFGGLLVQVAAPLIGLALAAGAWLSLPSLAVTTRIGPGLVELRRARRKEPVARLLTEEILAVRLSAARPHAGAASGRLADRQVQLVTQDGNETVAIAGPAEARALAQGLSSIVKAPLRDDTPEAEATFCLQQALLAMDRYEAAPEPPEGFRIRATLEKGWLLLELPGRGPGAASRAALVAIGIFLLVAPSLLSAFPALENSVPLAVGLACAALGWLAAIVLAVRRTHRVTALAASPLGVKVSRGRMFGTETISLPPPVSARRSGSRLVLTGDARLVVDAGASERDLQWAAEAIESLSGQPLVPRGPGAARS